MWLSLTVLAVLPATASLLTVVVARPRTARQAPRELKGHSLTRLGFAFVWDLLSAASPRDLWQGSSACLGRFALATSVLCRSATMAGNPAPRQASFVALANHSAPSHVPLQALVPGVLATPEQRGLSSRSMVDMRWLRTRSNSFVFLVLQRKDSRCVTEGQTSSGRARRSNYLNGSNGRKIAPVCCGGEAL